jgi:hypothetical protein
MQQINPPFDGSAPCPMCRLEIRSLYAYAHNLLNRWPKGDRLPQPKFWIKLEDLKRCANGEAGFATVGHDAGAPLDRIETESDQVRAHLFAIRDLLQAYARHARPYNSEEALPVADALAPFVDALRETAPAVGLLMEAHGDDARHASGGVNVLREQRGFSADRGGEYAWTVQRALGVAGDIVHKVCGTGFVLHSHFRERIKRDRAFYAKVHCLTCRQDVPFDQFDCRI